MLPSSDEAPSGKDFDVAAASLVANLPVVALLLRIVFLSDNEHVPPPPLLMHILRGKKKQQVGFKDSANKKNESIQLWRDDKLKGTDSGCAIRAEASSCLLFRTQYDGCSSLQI